MADRVAEKMSQASATRGMSLPKKGEQYRCEECGMEIKITADCRCNHPEHVHLECCGQEMAKV